MTDVWLAVIAIAVAIMAAIQVGAIVVGLRMARRVEQRVDRLTSDFEREIKPLVQNLTDMSAEAQRAVRLASAQVERADRLFGDLALTAERTMAVASQFVGGPARNGFALFTAARAAFSAFRDLRAASARRRPTYRSAADDEESLFIG